jgi:hypothetical protein
MMLQRVPELESGGAGRGAARDHYQIQARDVILTCPEAFAYLAFDAVAHYGTGRHLARDGNAEACQAQTVGAPIDREAEILAALTTALCGQKLFASPKMLRAKKPA